MYLHIADILIILTYFILVMGLGFYVSKNSEKDMNSYFLGGNSMKWYILGLSNSSGMFDVNAVSWRVAILIMYGIQSVWIPWVWPVWNQVFVMIFLSTWLRRSGAMTGAEWMRIRFGDGLGGRLSHIIVVVFAVVEVMISIGIFFTGIGGLAAELLPDLSVGSLGIDSKTMYAFIICFSTMLYSIKGGIFSIVATEVLQFLIMTVCCVIIFILGMNMTDQATLNGFLPSGWLDFWPKNEINYAWPEAFSKISDESMQNGFRMIAGMVGLMIGKGMLASLAGPVPGFDMQRSFSSKSPREAAKMSGFTILVLFIPLYMMVTGFALMAIKELPAQIDGISKIEHIFNIIVKQLPTGIKGLVIAGLLAAFMSTFSAFVNVAPAYLVNDLYKRYLRPSETPQHYVRIGQWMALIVVIVGIFIGTQIKSLNEIILFLTGAFYGGYAAPNVLKWIWWRFNGYGYFAGMLSGMLAAMVGNDVVKFLVQGIPTLEAMADTQAINLMSFVFIFIVSLTGCIAGCLLTPSVDEATTDAFYRKTKPWGFWKPVIQKINQLDPGFVPNLNFKTDATNVLIGIAWQMSMVVMPVFAGFRQWQSLGFSLFVFVATTWLLKRLWYDRLEEIE
jgi:solute:Na+ symporter, SSS family